jgi:hypothetical protein
MLSAFRFARQPEPHCDVIATRAPILAGEAVNDEIGAIETDGQAAVVRPVIWTGTKHLASGHLAPKRDSRLAELTGVAMRFICDIDRRQPIRFP